MEAFDAGFRDCEEEAVRFLMATEQVCSDHPLVLGLRQHLRNKYVRYFNTPLQCDYLNVSETAANDSAVSLCRSTDDSSMSLRHSTNDSSMSLSHPADDSPVCLCHPADDSAACLRHPADDSGECCLRPLAISPDTYMTADSMKVSSPSKIAVSSIPHINPTPSKDTCVESTSIDEVSYCACAAHQSSDYTTSAMSLCQQAEHFNLPVRTGDESNQHQQHNVNLSSLVHTSQCHCSHVMHPSETIASHACSSQLISGTVANDIEERFTRFMTHSTDNVTDSDLSMLATYYPELAQVATELLDLLQSGSEEHDSGFLDDSIEIDECDQLTEDFTTERCTNNIENPTLQDIVLTSSPDFRHPESEMGASLRRPAISSLSFLHGTEHTNKIFTVCAQIDRKCSELSSNS